MLPSTRVASRRIVRFSLKISLSNRGKQLSSSNNFLLALPKSHNQKKQYVTMLIKCTRKRIYSCIYITDHKQEGMVSPQQNVGGSVGT